VDTKVLGMLTVAPLSMHLAKYGASRSPSTETQTALSVFMWEVNECLRGLRSSSGYTACGGRGRNRRYWLSYATALLSFLRWDTAHIDRYYTGEPPASNDVIDMVIRTLKTLRSLLSQNHFISCACPPNATCALRGDAVAVPSPRSLVIFTSDCKSSI